MEKKIYVTLKEVENLIFNKYLEVEKERLEIGRAQGLFGIDLNLNLEDLIQKEDKLVILFSAITRIGIPQNDERLFIRHYKVPAGLLALEGRNIRDQSKEEIPFPEQEKEEQKELKDYKQLRHGMVGMVYNAYQMKTVGLDQNSMVKALQDVAALSPLKRQLLTTLLEYDEIPILEVRMDKIVTNHFFRVVWWAKFIKDHYLDTLNLKDEVREKSISYWLRGFLEFDNIEHLNKQLAETPDELRGEIDFLLGYYFAVVNFESYSYTNDFIQTLYERINYEFKDELFNWISFFISFYTPTTNRIYFVESLRESIFEIEKLAYGLAVNSMEINDEFSFHYELKQLEKVALITEYGFLINGSSRVAPRLVKENEVKEVFRNQFFQDNLHNLGFEVQSQFEVSGYCNYCWLSKADFHLKLNKQGDWKDKVFYLKPDSQVKDYLRNLRLKTSTVDKLIDKKKVLLSFIRQGRSSQALHLYASILGEHINKNFEKIVLVLLVDKTPEEIQSIEFDQELNTLKKEYNRMFAVETELIVKNIQTRSNVEIIRNLRNALSEYRIQQIEVLDENFNVEQAVWLIESGTEFYIDKGDANFYCFVNLD